MVTDIDTSIANLHQAWQAFCSGKKGSRAIDLFRANVEPQLLDLHRDIKQGQYRHGRYETFIVHDPKRREIAVANVRDRVVHRLLYDYLLPIWNASFCYDAWSCRPDKGLAGAIDRTQVHASKYRHGWLWRSDIAKFFDHVDQDILRAILRTKLHQPGALSLLDEVIGSFTTDSRQACGMPIGNLTSQIFANIYLNEFDQFVLHSLKPLGYVRYGDDFVLWYRDELAAREAEAVGTQFLHDELTLTVNSRHNRIQPAQHKLSYLGVELWPHGRRLQPAVRQRITGHVSMTNLASYQALVHQHQPARHHRRFAWQALDIIDDV